MRFFCSRLQVSTVLIPEWKITIKNRVENITDDLISSRPVFSVNKKIINLARLINIFNVPQSLTISFQCKKPDIEKTLIFTTLRLSNVIIISFFF